MLVTPIRRTGDEICMTVALDQAIMGLRAHSLPVGAAVFCGDRLIGASSRDTNDQYFNHAEMNALRAALGNSGYHRDQAITIYSTLEPCVMCFGAILHCPITRVVFALEDPWGGATSVVRCLRVPRHADRVPEVAGGVLRDESLKLLREFAETSREPRWRDVSNPLVRLIRHSVH